MAKNSGGTRSALYGNSMNATEQNNMVGNIQGSYKNLFEKEESRILNNQIDYNQKDLNYLKKLRKVGNDYQKGELEKYVDVQSKNLADRYKKVYNLEHANMGGYTSEFYRILYAKSANENLDRIKKAIKEKSRK